MTRHHRTLAAVAATCTCLVGLGAQFGTPTPPRFSFSVGATNLTRIAVDSIADVNNDQLRDILVGMPDLDRVELRGGRTGLVLATTLGGLGTSFGYEVASVGDIDGDGFEEIAVGAIYAGNGTVTIYSYTGGALVLRRTFAQTPPHLVMDVPAQYGTAITRLGDVTGDGIEEIAVSAPFYSPVGAAIGYWGLVEVVNIGANPPIKTNTLVGTTVWEEIGDSLTRVQDLTGDGMDELAVGASRQYLGGVFPGLAPGLVRVFSGASLSGPTVPPVVLGQAVGLFNFDYFGWASANVTDVNGDGSDDLLVGAPEIGNGLTGGQSYVQVFSGAAIAAAGGGVVAPMYTVNEPGPASLHFGWAVSGTGDLNGDNVRDLLVGAPEIYSGVGAIGGAYVLNGVNGAPLLSLNATTATPSFGNDVSEHAPGRKVQLVADPVAGLVHIH